MKCLRCGREMGSNTIRCDSCRHYYESNLKKANATVTYFDSEKDREKSRKRITIITISLICLFLVIFIGANYRNIVDIISPPWVVSRCDIVCEGHTKRVIFTKCICDNGDTIKIE